MILRDFLLLLYDICRLQIRQNIDYMTDFQKSIIEGIPDVLPAPKPFDPTVNHAPHRKQILTAEEKKLALRNALRYFPPKHHAELIPEFKEELETYGRIYMYRLRPDYKIYAPRAHRLRRQRSGFPELGPVPSDHAVSVPDDGRADSCAVFVWSLPTVW